MRGVGGKELSVVRCLGEVVVMCEVSGREVKG